jgi:hypothetical protein
VIRLFIAGLMSAALSLAQQTKSVVNAASQSGGVAPGSILSIRQLRPPQIIGAVDPIACRSGRGHRALRFRSMRHWRFAASRCLGATACVDPLARRT